MEAEQYQHPADVVESSDLSYVANVVRGVEHSDRHLHGSRAGDPRSDRRKKRRSTEPRVGKTRSRFGQPRASHPRAIKEIGDTSKKNENWSEPSAKSTGRLYHCDACDVWMPRGPSVWRTHVSGIKHRRQVLSLRYTGQRGEVFVSAFENEASIRLSGVGRHDRERKGSGKDREAAAKRSTALRAHNAFLSRARTMVSTHVLNMFGRDASRLYHSAAACFNDDAFLRCYDDATDAFAATVQTLDGQAAQSDAGTCLSGDDGRCLKRLASGTVLCVHFSVDCPGGIVRVVDDLQRKGPLAMVGDGSHDASRSDANVGNGIFPSHGEQIPHDGATDSRISVCVQARHSAARGGIDSGQAAAYFAAFQFLLDALSVPDHSVAGMNVERVRELEFECKGLLYPLGDAVFKQGFRHVLRGVRRLLEQNLRMQRVVLRLVDRASASRQMSEWTSRTVLDFQTGLKEVSEERDRACRMAVLMGTHHRLGSCSPVRMLPRSVLQLVMNRAISSKDVRQSLFEVQ